LLYRFGQEGRVLTFILMAGAFALLTGFTGAMPAPMARAASLRPSDDELPRDFTDVAVDACPGDEQSGSRRLLPGQTRGSELVH
jgi:hypothetical protein